MTEKFSTVPTGGAISSVWLLSWVSTLAVVCALTVNLYLFPHWRVWAYLVSFNCVLIVVNETQSGQSVIKM